MVWIGIAIVFATFYFIIKNYETRLVLILSGVIMAALGGNIVSSVNAFVKEFTNSGLVPTICIVMGFSYVMDYTGCSKHLVAFLTNLLKKVPLIIIPGSVLVTFFLNIAIPSAAGVAAAVGTLLIPTLLAVGVRPAMAASAVFLGTWGSVMSPGLMFNPQVAEMAGVDVMTVIATFSKQVLLAALAAALILMVIAHIKKEGVGSQRLGDEIVESASIKINYLFALIPVLPIVLLVLGSKQVQLIPEFTVPQAMLLGTALGFVVTRKHFGDMTKQFFRGVGDGFCDVVGIIAAAAMFIQGMQVIGLTDALLDMMKGSQQIAKFTAAFGPFIIAAISGTGNAAALAFNGAVTPHAATFGYGIIEMGSMVQIGGGLGRTMSPVAPSAIILAKIAGINPMEITKRNMIPTIVATFIVLFTLM
ncbi:C4-dicarboxylate transporter DcuC|uniref:C4-dicarboxylate transporter, DcuC family n=1 Tax=Dendrosporobacter quercicolus TaxID=146817 RepID=A0A1G9ZFU9_9FIRM|nr:C4-dicarboxylate transporter DcuC [Dendrosporobacter quercicolus]NSL49806.1 C4-dicarboxylate transporter DcuC [Dendrosporobacter quercicolus DSM 1736]SDN20302.1 C4-dicarboxylate transporter, DcuC family [Dendrosporobacter quercicolus]